MLRVAADIAINTYRKHYSRLIAAKMGANGCIMRYNTLLVGDNW